MRTRVLFVCLALLAAAGFVAHPGLTTGAQGPTPTPTLSVSGWIPGWAADKGIATFRAHTDRIKSISPVWYDVNADGRLHTRKGARDAALVAEARAAGVLIIPTITNGFKPEPISSLLQDPAYRTALVNNILYEAVIYDLDGVDLDFENMYHQDRDRFTLFLSELNAALHAQDKVLTIAAQAKSYDAFDVDGPGALDYAAIGHLVDEMRIMTYGWCWSTGCVGGPPPGPISPIHWLTSVSKYAKRKMPASKIILGVNLYGYDWSPVAAGQAADCLAVSGHALFGPAAISPDETLCAQGISGSPVIWPDVEALVAAYAPEIQWWESNERGLVREHWFLYSPDHGVTFSDYDSVAARYALAEDLGLGGLVMWYLGAEDPTIWSLFAGGGVTPTATSTATPSSTPSTSPTATPSLTATTTPTRTPTPSSTPTPSPAPTSTPTPKFSPSPTGTPTRRPTKTPTAPPLNLHLYLPLLAIDEN